MKITKTAAFIMNVAIFLIVNSFVAAWLQNTNTGDNIVINITLLLSIIYTIYFLIKYAINYGKK